MIKILFILENLGGGGAERVLPNLLKYLDRKKYEATVLTLFSDGVNQQRLPKHVNHVCRKALYFRGITYLIKFLPPALLYNYYVKKALPKLQFDLIVAYMHGLPTKILLGAGNQKKITWVHANMLGGYKPHFPRFFLNKRNMRQSLEKLDAIVGVSEQIRSSFRKFTEIKKEIHLIHNTNDTDEIQHRASEFIPYKQDKNIVNIVSVGHLHKVKGNERLLQAAKTLRDEGFSFRLHILGEGAQRPELEAYITEHGLQSWVELPGFIDNPYPYIKHADLYICPSYSEGFSTAVSEAVILGVPVISTLVSGATEILGEQQEYGMICENSNAGICNALRDMLAKPDLRAHYAKMSRQRSIFFSPERTVKAVENLFDQITKSK